MDVQELHFDNGNTAQLLTAPAGSGVPDLLQALNLLQPRAVLLLSGGAAALDEASMPRLVQLLGGIARAAAEAGALVIDGGTATGVMALMGQAAADHDRGSLLLGVAPEGKVTYPGGPAATDEDQRVPLDHNHSRFILVQSAIWGSEIGTMYQIARELEHRCPIVTVLVNGGELSKKEVLRAVRQRYPVLIVEGSGGLADQVADLWHERSRSVQDPALAEILDEGRLFFFPSTVPPKEFRRLVMRFLDPDPNEEQLKLTWRQFATCNVNASRQQTVFHRLQNWIIGLAALITFLAVFQKQIEHGADRPGIWVPPSVLGFLGDLRAYLKPVQPALSWPLLILPIVTTVLLSVSNRFRPGNRWVFLRAAAEAIKSQIYWYRTRAGAYSQRYPAPSREETLAVNVNAIIDKLGHTEVNRLGLRNYDQPLPAPPSGSVAEGDDGMSFLTPDRYLQLRLHDQLAFYQSRTTRLDRQLKLYQIYIYSFGAVGSLLVALGLQLWTGVTAAMVTTLTGVLAYQQTENTLIKYNLARNDLEKILGWWLALDPEERGEQANVDRLVGATEKALQGELTGWVQQMQDTLAHLDSEQKAPDAGRVGRRSSGARGAASSHHLRQTPPPPASGPPEDALAPPGTQSNTERSTLGGHEEQKSNADSPGGE